MALTDLLVPKDLFESQIFSCLGRRRMNGSNQDWQTSHVITLFKFVPENLLHTKQFGN